MKKVSAFLALLFLSSSLLNTTKAETKDSFFIDSSLSASDQKTMKEVMSSLDKEDRENVLFIAEDGTIIANKPSLKSEFIEQNKGNIENGKLRKATAEELQERIVKQKDQETETADFTTAAYSTPALDCTNTTPGAGATGPFRRVESTKGFTRLEADIYLPSKAANEAYINPNSVGTSDDKGYIYTGSFIYAPNSNLLNYTVDLGLALNYNAGTSSSHETWGMYFNGGTLVSGTYGNYQLGSTVFMKYYISAVDQHTLTVSGKNKAGTSVTNTVVMATTNTKGFAPANASRISVRRVTSIAQNLNQEATTNSYIKNVNWTNVKVGTTSSSTVLANSSNTAYFCGYHPQNIQVDYISQSSESIWVKTGILP
jgi:hypothetical protein